MIASGWIVLLRRIAPATPGAGGARDRILPFFLLGLLSIPLLFGIYSHVLPPLWSREWDVAGVAWNNVVMVGIVEEFAKWAIFAVAMHRGRPLRSPEDGIVLAAAVALAFATIENVGYAFAYGPELLFYRGTVCVLGHMTYAALWGFVWAAITWETGGRIDRKRLQWGAATIVPAAIVHGLYNTSLNLNGWLAYVITGGGLWTAVVAYRYITARSPYRSIPYSESARAITELESALKLEPRNIVFHRRLGLHLLHDGRCRDASDHFDTVRRLSVGRSASVEFLCSVARFALSEPGHTEESLAREFRELSARTQLMMREHLPQALASNRLLRSRVVGIMAPRGTSPRRQALHA